MSIFNMLRMWLIEIYELARIGNRKTYFSQFGEDIFLRSYFRGRKVTGVYVDVGSNHPIRCSNTYLFYRMGWHGILIDPDRVSTALSTWLRPRDTTLRCAVGTPGTRTFYRASDPRQGTLLNNVATDNAARGIRVLGQEQVEVRALQDILEEHDISDPDVLSIDTEGNDLEVLGTINWSRTNPTAIVVEDHAFDEHAASSSAIYAYLVARDYRLACRLGYSLIFVRD